MYAAVTSLTRCPLLQQVHNLHKFGLCVGPRIVAVFAAQSPALVATRAAASAHEMGGCTAERIDGHFSAQSFYMYDAPELNHRWLRHCARFRELRHSSKAENSAEVGLHKVLARHPRRTRNPAEARLFYVPIFEYSSKFVGAACANASTTPAHLANHTARMAAAHGALLASPHWRAHGGRDHVWATTAFSAHGYSLEKRMQPLSSLLACSAVGRYKAGPFSRASAGGACVVEIPYQASLHVMRAASQAHPSPPRSSLLGPRHASTSLPITRPTTSSSPPRGSMSSEGSLRANDSKPTLLFFAGSLDVCCTGKVLRCAIADLHAAAFELADVVIRPTGGGPCTRRALSYVSSKGTGNAHATTTAAATAAGAPAVHASRAGGGGADAGVYNASGAYASDGLSGTVRYVSGGVVERTAGEMVASKFCLCPAGDTCVTSRLYTAIAAGCIPVVLCDQLVGAFAGAARYDSFWLKVPTKAFLRQPQALLPMVRAIAYNATELNRRQRALAAARSEVLYDAPASRVGTHFLNAVTGRCSLPWRPPIPDLVHSCQTASDVTKGASSRAQDGGRMLGSAERQRLRLGGVNESRTRDLQCLKRGGIATPA